MPAKVEFHTGPRKGEAVWLQERVTRVGSDEASQVQVQDPEVPAHAVTLEFRAGQFLVNNRSENPLMLEGRRLAPRQRPPGQR